MDQRPAVDWHAAALTRIRMANRPISFGPACWIYSRTDNQTLPQAYRPVGWLMSNVPRSVEMAFIKYALAGMPRGGEPVPRYEIGVVVGGG